MSVAAIVPTIPGREESLAAAVASVLEQTVLPDALYVQHDTNAEGPAVARNAAVERSETDWLAFLDDDDVWLPDHLETLLAHSRGADVVYSDCELVGQHNGLSVNVDFNPLALRVGNYIPVTTLVRRSMFNKVGGFNPEDRYEDWSLWLRMLDEGARFVHVPTVTWEYRWHGAQRTFA